MSKGRILAIDYGEKIFGLAISDEEWKFSFPLKNYRRKSNEEDILFLKNLIMERNIVKIIFGNPLNSKREESKMSKRVREFAKKLAVNIRVEIGFYDETFTTKEAELILREYGFKEKKMKGKKDSIAASFILSSYLETINESN